MTRPARLYSQQMVHFLRKNFTYADRGVMLTVGVVPAGSVFLKGASGVNVHTAFNGSGTDLIDMGTDANDDLYLTDAAGQTVGWTAFDEAVSQYVAAETTVTVTYTDSGSDATAGEGQAVVAYIPNTDG